MCTNCMLPWVKPTLHQSLPSLRTKWSVRLSAAAVLLTWNNTPHPHSSLHESSAFLEPMWWTSHMCPLSVAIMPSIRTSHFGGGAKENIIFKQKTALCNISKPAKRAMWCAVSQARISHNFWTKRNYREPSIHVDCSCNGESIPIAFRWKKGG